MLKNTESPGALLIPSIEALRALACLMVVYCHIVGRPIVIFKESWPPATLVNDFIITPLGIIKNFGFLGVGLFFLISGFIVTHTGLNETRFSFFIKRIFRIYPALLITVGATLWLATQAAAAGMTDGAIGIGYSNAWLAALGMEAGISKKLLLDVSWTISIELFFYAHMLALLPLLKTRPIFSIVLLIGWSILLAQLNKLAPEFPRTISHMAAYLPIFAIGAVIYFYWSSRITLSKTAALAALTWIALIINLTATRSDKLAALNSHTTQIAYALFIFLSALWLYQARAINNQAAVRFFANISYSLYLIHLPFSVAITAFLYPKIGLSGAILVSFAVSVVLAYSLYRLIEIPGQRIGRKLLSLNSRRLIGLVKKARPSTE
ncbi:MAG: acyltransferase [Pseudomonadota bacterium]